MTENHFIWPKSNVFQALSSVSRFTSVSIIEKKLQSMFLGGYPVLFSSGRAALVLALIESGVTRNDFVGVFPFASHCVLDAIARVATPLSGASARSALLRVVYHQWGYVQETDLSNNTIEDCVDTLCVPGAALFPGGGRFEIWSLPKILGTSSGGILWCRDEKTAVRIRDLRDVRGGRLFQWIMRLLGGKYPKAYDYWQGAEGTSGGVSRLQTGEIYRAVLNWEKMVADRLSKLNKIWPLAVGWLPRPIDRLPSVVPIEVDLPETMIQAMGISSGYRRMERFTRENDYNLIKLLPIPIHHDVSISWLELILRKIDSHKSGARKN